MLEVTIRLCLTLLWLTVIIQTQDNPLEAPQDNQAPSFKAPPVCEVKISGTVVASIKNGDFVHPTFSPDGKTLAYSNVLVQRKSENTEVLLYDLITQKTSVLLSSRKAKQYSTYAAFVTGMNWKSAKRLEVSVSDGDVGSTNLTFDPYRRRLLREKYEQEDEPGADQLSPTNRKAFEQAQALFPSFPRDVLESALKSSSPLVIPGQGIVLQKNYAGHDNNVWFLDFQNKTIKTLINLPADSSWAFNGGASFQSSILMLVTVAQKSYVFLYRDGQVSVLGELNSSNVTRLEIKHVSKSKLIFLVRTHGTSERGDNPLFVFVGETIFRAREHAELYDVAVDPNGRRIAYCYWAGDRRHIVVNELK